MPEPSRNSYDAVDRIDQHESDFEFADDRFVEMLDHSEIELPVPRQLVGVRKAAAQTAADDGLGREGGPAQS